MILPIKYTALSRLLVCCTPFGKTEKHGEVYKLT